MKDQDPCFQELVCPKVLIYAAHFLELFDIYMYIINYQVPNDVHAIVWKKSQYFSFL